MNEILDSIDPKSDSNFRAWSFRLLIYTIVLNAIIFYYVANYIVLNLYRLEILNIFFIALGVVFTYLSYINNEPRDYKFISSVIGFSLLGLMVILSIVQQFTLS